MGSVSGSGRRREERSVIGISFYLASWKERRVKESAAGRESGEIKRWDWFRLLLHEKNLIFKM